MARSVGDMNGRWALAFKAFLISWPVVVGWAGWVSWTVINHGERLVAVETILAKVP